IWSAGTAAYDILRVGLLPDGAAGPTCPSLPLRLRLGPQLRDLWCTVSIPSRLTNTSNADPDQPTSACLPVPEPGAPVSHDHLPSEGPCSAVDPWFQLAYRSHRRTWLFPLKSPVVGVFRNCRFVL